VVFATGSQLREESVLAVKGMVGLIDALAG